MQSIATVLVVEDEPLILMDVAFTLGSAGFNVVEATSADQALFLLAGGLRIDALVTDVDMPGVSNGIALAHSVSKSLPGVRIVVTSGRQENGKMIPVGAKFVPKPAAPDAIIRDLAI